MIWGGRCNKTDLFIQYELRATIDRSTKMESWKYLPSPPQGGSGSTISAKLSNNNTKEKLHIYLWLQSNWQLSIHIILIWHIFFLCVGNNKDITKQLQEPKPANLFFFKMTLWRKAGAQDGLVWLGKTNMKHHDMTDPTQYLYVWLYSVEESIQKEFVAKYERVCVCLCT